MFDVFRRLFGSKPEPEMPEFIVEKPAPKKSVGETRRLVYDQIAESLYWSGIFSSSSGYDLYPKLKKNLLRVNEIMEANKETLVVQDWELRALNAKILENKNERNLTSMTYYISKLITKNRYEDQAILREAITKRIMEEYNLY